MNIIFTVALLIKILKLKPKQPVVGNNLIQYHLSQNSRLDNSQNSLNHNMMKPVLTLNPMNQMQPVIFIYTLLNLLNIFKIVYLFR